MLTHVFCLPYHVIGKAQTKNNTMKILHIIWEWLKRLFSFPVEKDPATDEATTPDPAPIGAPTGFNPDFLPVKVDFPKMENSASRLLHYHHFSVVMNPERRLPFYTAVNIDAEGYNRLKAEIPSRKQIGADSWVQDKRLPREEQLPASFYVNNDFDIGHMVRREDVLWGDTLEQALAANKDTFHLTNAAPQHKDFNRCAQRWKGLEDYALQNARRHNLRVSVFSGCIFDEQDRKHRDVQIPGKFWKILVMVKENGELSATGYIVQQDDLIEGITERGGFQYEQFKTYQVPLAQIEQTTGLQFRLNEHDPLQKMATRGGDMTPLSIDDYADIIF